MVFVFELQRSNWNLKEEGLAHDCVDVLGVQEFVTSESLMQFLLETPASEEEEQRADILPHQVEDVSWGWSNLDIELVFHGVKFITNDVSDSESLEDGVGFGAATKKSRFVIYHQPVLEFSGGPLQGGAG